MAQLKDTVVSGNLRITDSAIADKVQTSVIKAPTASGGSTYGPGTNGQVLKSNGTTVYWATDSNSVTGVKGNSESSYRTGQVNLTAANVGAVAVSQGSGNSGKFLMVNSSGNVEATSVTTKAATTYNVSTSDQTIAAGTYLTGVQTFRAVTTSGIDAANIKDGAVIKVGDANSATRIKNVTGTFTDAATVSSGQTAAAAAQIRTGYSAWVDGAEVKGSIANLAATTYNTSTSDQTIAAGKYINGTQTIKAVTTANIAAANIKTGVTVTVGDANSSTRIANVAGTFTAASTVSSGQTAAAAGQILSGYSAWVGGAEIKGSIANGTITNNTSGGTSTATINRGKQIKIGAGYYASDAYYTAQANANTLSITNANHNAQTNISVDGYANINVTGIKVPKNKGFTISTVADTALDTTSDLDVTNNAYRRVDIVNNANGTVIVKTSGTVSAASYSASAGDIIVSAFGPSAAENNKSVVSAGKWVNTLVSAAGIYYGRVSVSEGSASSSLTSSNATINTTNNSGISVTPRYTTTNGYVGSASNVNGTTQYINGVSLPKGKYFDITVYVDSSNTVTFRFTTDSSGNTTVSNP